MTYRVEYAEDFAMDDGGFVHDGQIAESGVPEDGLDTLIDQAIEWNQWADDPEFFGGRTRPHVRVVAEDTGDVVDLALVA